MHKQKHMYTHKQKHKYMPRSWLVCKSKLSRHIAQTVARPCPFSHVNATRTPHNASHTFCLITPVEGPSPCRAFMHSYICMSLLHAFKFIFYPHARAAEAVDIAFIPCSRTVCIIYMCITHLITTFHLQTHSVHLKWWNSSNCFWAQDRFQTFSPLWTRLVPNALSVMHAVPSEHTLSFLCAAWPVEGRPPFPWRRTHPPSAANWWCGQVRCPHSVLTMHDAMGSADWHAPSPRPRRKMRCNARANEALSVSCCLPPHRWWCWPLGVLKLFAWCTHACLPIKNVGGTSRNHQLAIAFT
jgi:hypothetical protein